MGSVPWSSAFARTHRRRKQRWRKGPFPRLIPIVKFLAERGTGSAFACHLPVASIEPPQGTKEAARPRRQPPRGLPFRGTRRLDAIERIAHAPLAMAF